MCSFGCILLENKSSSRIKFLVQVVYDMPPRPSILHSWGKLEMSTCPLCSKCGAFEHIINCCTKALGKGPYRWRHDEVLKTVTEFISLEIDSFERKLTKCDGLVRECQQGGWRARCFSVEVGYMGFAAQFLARALSTLSIEGEKKRRATCKYH